MQGGSGGIVYGGLKYQARCIADVRADTGSTTFLAGTLSLKEENEVHLIRLSPAESELVCDGLFYHPNEIWDLKSCPFDHRVFSTVYTSGEGYGAAVWKIPELYGQSNSPQLEQLFALDGHAGKIRRVLWWPVGKHDKLISIDDRNIFLWNIDTSNKSAKLISQGSADMLPNLQGGAWDPHNYNSVAAISDSSLHLWDLRSMEKSIAIEHAHIRDVDYNPKKQNIIATAEDEFGIRLWDLRMLKHPLKYLPGHSHWTWAVRHNPEYDELILSAGTDSTVNLWLAKVGSDDSGSESPSGSPKRQEEPLLNSYTDYEDSIYGIAWSSHDPSLFASLSYDGRVVLESVKPYLQRK
ncbi:WD repeat-containing protein DWA2-like [Phragmites australis]|uniref:WD repeat-containing protein DWA2-like n=1 Tax=Phragmites australis TaxID=29695 RepID=UPI002D7A10DD|nr:WD repeat-containing protein DWA2-like [Phragmites australis]XP_062194996.1 WD repeat-containing protein DWA2-like [Phragmites australis]